MSDESVEFIMMTCNIGNGRAKPENLIPVLRASNADVIGMQEVSDGQAAAVASLLSSEYPHQALFPGGFAGKAVLSRHPLSCIEQLHLSTIRPDLLATVTVNEKSFTLIVAHPPPPRLYLKGIRFDAQTWKQIQTLVQLAHDHTPAVLLGDFNLADWWGEYAYLRAAGLKDAYVEAGKKVGHTLPTRIGPWKRLLTVNRMISWMPLVPVLRVDYIWYTGALTSLDSWVGADTGSDHLPVLARLAL